MCDSVYSVCKMRLEDYGMCVMVSGLAGISMPFGGLYKLLLEAIMAV
jgi:hypothetical protein